MYGLVIHVKLGLCRWTRLHHGAARSQAGSEPGRAKDNLQGPTTDVGASAPVHDNVKVHAGAAGVLADEALGIGFIHGPLQGGALVEVLPPAQRLADVPSNLKVVTSEWLHASAQVPTSAASARVV